MNDKIIIVNPGHGGIINGVYQTAPKKMFNHENGDTAYEGVINRNIAKLVCNGLTSINIRNINLCPTELDIPLDERADIANIYVRNYGIDNVLGLELHCNAGNGRGFEGWTGPSQTKSDIYMTLFIEVFKEYFPEWKIRTDSSDGDPDKESPFYMLVNTKCPWILPEWGFFDNKYDWKIINDPVEQLRYAKMIIDFVKRVITKNL